MKVNANTLEAIGVNKAKALAAHVMTVRTLYAQQIVPRAKESGMRMSDDGDTMANTLPQPATLINVLGQQIQKDHPGTAIRLYSRLPFSHRKEIEANDQFEKDALTVLEQKPDIPFLPKGNH